MAVFPSEFRTDLEAYRGPLDLLLYLIKRDELDILDIPLADITNQYIEYIKILESLDPNVCGEFLVMAARLMELKSRSLLPVELEEGSEEELEDPRLELMLQLLEYKKYKERALLLEKLEAEHSRRHRRPGMDLAELVDSSNFPVSIGNVSVWDLLTAFQKVQLNLSLRQPHRVLHEDRPVQEYIKAIETRFEEQLGDEIEFEDLFAACQDRYDAIGFFLAILEMAKLGQITVYQDDQLGAITVKKCDVPVPQGVEPTSDAASEAPASPSGEESATAGDVAGNDSPENA